MNKSYKVVFNKAHNKMVVANELSKTDSNATIIASCVTSVLLLLYGSTSFAAATNAFSAVYTFVKNENNVTVGHIGTHLDANDKYLSSYIDGISGVTNAFYAKGWTPTTKFPNPALSTISLTTSEIIASDVSKGAFAVAGTIVLGNSSTKSINFSAKSNALEVGRLGTIDLTADSILLNASNSTTAATTISVNPTSSTKSGEISSVSLNALRDIYLSSKSEQNSAHILRSYGHNASILVESNSLSLISESKSISSQPINAQASGLNVEGGNTVNLLAKNISFDQKSKSLAWAIRSLSYKSEKGSQLLIGNSDTQSISMSVVATEGSAYGIYSDDREDTRRNSDGSIFVIGDNIAFNIHGKTTTSGAEFWNGQSAVIGKNNSIVTLRISSDEGEALGLSTQLGSNLIVNGKGLFLDVTGKHSIGIHTQNNTQTDTENLATVTINSEKTTIKADTALSAMSQGRIYINGDLDTESKTAVLARGNALVSVNETGNNTVKLTGDVDFNYNGTNSGTTTDAIVNINLSNANSSWIGNSKTSVDSGTPSEDLRTGQLNLGLSNGATWTPTEIDPSVNNSRAEAIASVTLDNGVINLTNEGAESVDIKNLSGNGIVNTDVTKATDGTLTAAGKLNIQSGTSKLSIMAQGITADDVADESQLTAITDIINGGDSSVVTKTTTVKEGAVKGEITQTTDASGNTSTTQGSNSKLTAFNSISDMATMAWRHDMNDLTKRMGELRDSPEGIGSWVRFYGSEQEYGRQNMTSKSTSVQLGSDYDIGSGWKVGGAFTYTDGTSKYDNGSSDNKAYGVAAYGSWLADNGAFVDLIGKYSRLSSDFELSSMDGKSKNNALSASVEAGWHIPFAELAFVEPQAELTYGVLLGDDFTTSNGVKISQEDTEALIGRLGVRTGFHFPNKKGTVYARASVLHDFKGESEFTASLVDDASVRSTMKDDIGGTYYEIGVGANFNWTDNAYSYVDLEKQNGGDVKENWRWNVGFRYVW